jgi:hypothetical protein
LVVVLDDELLEDELPDDSLVASCDELSLLDLLELYKSENQPPPLRMKPVPAEISRLAFASPHVGQSVIASSFIDCTASHW